MRLYIFHFGRSKPSWEILGGRTGRDLEFKRSLTNDIEISFKMKVQDVSHMFGNNKDVQDAFCVMCPVVN